MRPQPRWLTCHLLCHLLSLTLGAPRGVNVQDLGLEDELIDELERYLDKRDFQAIRATFATRPWTIDYDASPKTFAERKTFAEGKTWERGMPEVGPALNEAELKEKRMEQPKVYDSNAVTSQRMRQLESESDAVNQAAADIYLVAGIAGCSVIIVCSLLAAGSCWYRLRKKAKAAADTAYPAYGVTGPSKDVSPTGSSASGGDRKLAQSAQMYHYQHQKQQMIAMESHAATERKTQGIGSDVESEEEDNEGEYTVYECPGLAPTGEMEVTNPLFQDDPPSTPRIIAAD